MYDAEQYYIIASNIYAICYMALTAYCFVIWVEPFLPYQAKAWLAGAVYVSVMLILKVVPYEFAGMAAYGIGSLSVLATICLMDREYTAQKLFLVITFSCLRWQAWRIAFCLDNELYLIWQNWYIAAIAKGNVPWIFELQWFWVYLISSIMELLTGFLLMYGAVRFMLRAYGRKREHMGAQEFVLLIMPAVMSTAAEGLIRYYANTFWENAGANVEEYYDGYDFLLLFYLLLCYATILTTTYVFRRWKNEQEEDKEREVLSRQMEDMENHISQVERLYRDMRSLRHDMGNHLMTLEKLYSVGEYEAAEKYTEALREEMRNASSDVQSGNPVTDVILSDRKKEMEEKGILFDCDFHYPQKGNIDAFDISIILNNGLSNAIEAVEREESLRSMLHPDKYGTDAMYHDGKNEGHDIGFADYNETGKKPRITLSSHLEKNIFIIEMINGYLGEIPIDPANSLPQSTKQDGGHGFGLASIRRVARKYLGDMEIGKETYEGRECCVLRVMLQIEGVSEAEK